MQWTFLLPILASIAVLIAAVILLRRKPVVDIEQSARIQMLGDHIFKLQTSISEQLQNQEREISKKLEERLGDVSLRLGQGLHENFKETQKNLGQLQERLAVIDTAQKNITELSSQVVGLQDILSSKDKRGIFGEVQLKDLVVNVLPPSAYAFQSKLSNGTIPDCLIKLPNPPGAIVVDAKFPLESYERLVRAENPADKKTAEGQFAASIRTHIRDIAKKYILPGETADSALMFLPSESVYAELYARFPEVVQDAYRARVWVVSPTTLMATLTTVRAVLRDVQMQEQAGVILKEVKEISRDVERLDERVGKLQKHFDQATRDVSDIRVSTDKIIGRAGRLGEADSKTTQIANDIREGLAVTPLLKQSTGSG